MFYYRLQNTTDAVAAQFFLKNVHPEMRSAALELFGKPELHSRPNVFGELMRVLISPSPGIEAAVKSVLATGEEPDITLHVRMLMSRYCNEASLSLEHDYMHYYLLGSTRGGHSVMVMLVFLQL